MKLRSFVFILALMLFGNALLAQSNKEKFMVGFAEANKLMEEKFWYQAIKEWKKVLALDPENLNVNYKLGYCLLNTENEKVDALKYLEIACSKKLNKNYDPFEPTEKLPPVDALFLLGQAQHLNMQFDQSIKTFVKLKTQVSREHRLVPEANYAIKICEEAKIQVANPINYKITNAGNIINGKYADFSPVLTFDESSIFFTSRRLRPDSTNSEIRDPETDQFKDDIYVSFRTKENTWSKPELLNLNTDDHDASISVSPDGLTLFVYQDSLGDGQLKYSKLIGETWSDPAKLGSDINTSHWETHVTVSADGNELYFVSNRPEGSGGRDIYRCVKLPDGNWSKALNIGKKINTKYEEDAPFLSPDGQFLYFASKGHNTMGGFDLFVSKKDKNGNWGDPQNMGYPLNTVDDDVFFQPMADGKRAYYSSRKDGGEGELDVYLVEMPTTKGTQLAVFKGFIRGEEGQPLPDNLRVVITNLKTGEKQEVSARKKDGKFLATLLPCTNYHVDFLSGIVKIKQEDITIPCDGEYYEIEREAFLIAFEEEVTIKAKDEMILTFDRTKPIQIKLNLELGIAEYSNYFVYGSAEFSTTDTNFKNFLQDCKKVVKKKGKVEIYIESSASNVPVKSYSNNEDLAKARAQKAQKTIEAELKKMGFKTDVNFVFLPAKSMVQGKKYENDKDTARDEYEKYQYIKIKVQ
jgi:tetratricopeptide (TPR) repeat protein